MRVCNWVAIMTAGLLLIGCQSAGNIKRTPEQSSEVARINTQLAVEYVREGDYQGAMDKLTHAVEADPKYIAAHNTLALLHNLLGQYDKAEATFRGALRLDANDSNVLNNFGQFLCQRGRFDEGEKMFLKAVDNPLYRTPEIAYSNAGTCAIGRGDLDAGEAHFRRALEINSRLAPALLQMSQISLDRGHHLPARAYLQRYRELAKHTPKTLWLGIQIERELGDQDAVSSYSLQLQKSYPDSKETGLLLQSRSP